MAFWINYLSDIFWNIYLPLLIILGLFINLRMMMIRSTISAKDNSKWNLATIKAALSISLASKMGTGAIIGVLTAMWLSSDAGRGGESIVLWVFIGMFIMLPITYSEVLFTQVTKLTPRFFIQQQLNARFA